MNLPDVDFISLDGSDIEREIFSYYEKITGRKLYPGNPERLFLEAVVYVIALQRWHIDHSAKQNLLAYAQGEFLDHLGALLGVYRLQAQPSRVLLRFYIEPQHFDVIIPNRTRIACNKVYFATEKEATIKADEAYVDVYATCLETGSVGNGFIPGQINTLVDPVAYVKKVENITTSFGGSDVESDEHLRERIRLAPESFSNAGSRGAYIFHTKSAHPEIADVAVYSPDPGRVKVLFILNQGKIPDASMVDKVKEYLNDEKIRPLTDTVEVSPPVEVGYDIDLKYYVHKEDASLVRQIQSRVEQAVSEYILWQKSKIGRDILPEELIKKIKEAKAYRVNVIQPEYRQLSIEALAVANTVNIVYGGVVDD